MLTTRTTTTALAIVALSGSLALGAGLAGLGGSRCPRAARNHGGDGPWSGSPGPWTRWW